MKHLDEAGESYLEHAQVASAIGLVLILAGLAALLHALMPSIFQTTASDAVRFLARTLDKRNGTGED